MKKALLFTMLWAMVSSVFAQVSPDVKVLKAFTLVDVPQNLVCIKSNGVNVRESPSTRAPKMQDNFGTGYRQVGRWVYPCLNEKNGWYNIKLIPSMLDGWVSGTLAKHTGQTPIEWAKHRNNAYMVQDGIVRVALHKETGLVLMEHQVEIGSYDDDDVVSYVELSIGKQVSPGLVVFYSSCQLDYYDNNNVANDPEFVKYRDSHSVNVSMKIGSDNGGWMSYDLENIPSKILLRIFGKPESEISAEFGCVYITEDLLTW